jgi:hypothetical protein
MHSYHRCVALDERFGPNDVIVDLRTNQQPESSPPSKAPSMQAFRFIR